MFYLQKCFILHVTRVSRQHLQNFLDPEVGAQKATLVVVIIKFSYSFIPKAFLIRSRMQRNFAYTFVLTLPTDLLSQIFHLFSN